MALAETTKIQLIALKKDQDKVLKILQSAGSLELKEVENDHKNEVETEKINKELQKINLNYANLDFTINLLKDYAEKKGLFAASLSFTEKEIEEKATNYDYSKIIKRCVDVEDELTKAKNKIAANENDLESLKHWKNISIDLENLSGSEKTQVLLGSINEKVSKDFQNDLYKISTLLDFKIIKKEGLLQFVQIIFEKELRKNISQVLSKYKFIEADLPDSKGSINDYCQNLTIEINKEIKNINKLEKELKKMAKELDDLKISHDYLGWQQERLEETLKNGSTEYSFIINGWIPIRNMQPIKEEIEKVTQKYNINKIKPDKDEDPPVIIKNPGFMEPFEAVTGVYGLPLHSEVDPTPFLSAFFIVFFALCLTDAGYGIIMAITMALALKFVNLNVGMKKLVKLLMYGGIVTFVIGAIFGGWFGFTPDQVPEFLTYEAANGEKLFILQQINALTDPITVLILALGLGFVQILLGTFIKLVHDYRHISKKDALLDTGPWAFMITGIGIFILGAAGALPAIVATIGKWWVIVAAISLILTQGRDKKSIIGKFFSGTLSLYGLIGYMSDVLSYSRLLALGLATAIIAMAVNIIAALLNDLIPYIGWIFMIIVFIGGHLFNLVINALGSFIHSGRLQFVEFFGKFIEGGGRAFKPLSKKTKYIFLKKDS
ncbi:V-type ATP synthase subunit I [Patescibacteria group bacterium]